MTEKDKSLQNLDLLGRELKSNLRQSVDDGIFDAKLREVDSRSKAIEILDQAALHAPTDLERETLQASSGFLRSLNRTKLSRKSRQDSVEIITAAPGAGYIRKHRDFN